MPHSNAGTGRKARAQVFFITSKDVADVESSWAGSWQSVFEMKKKKEKRREGG